MKKSLDWIEKNLRVLYSRIGHNVFISSKKLGFYRIFIGFYFLLFRPRFLWLADVPASLFRPKSLTVASLFESLPGPVYFHITDVLITILLLLIILGVKARIPFLVLSLCIIINNSFAFSFGKIDHNIFTPLLFLILFFTNCGVHYSFIPDKKWKTQKIALSIFAICLAFGLFTAGYEKLLNWVDFDLHTSGILNWFYGGYFNLGRDKLLAEYFFKAPFWLTEIMDYLASVFEVSGIIFLLIGRRSWHFYLICAVIFHTFNTLILNIPFRDHVIIYGIWLLSPFLYRNKITIIILLLGLFFQYNAISLALWVFLLLASIYSWYKGMYRVNPTCVHVTKKINLHL